LADQAGGAKHPARLLVARIAVSILASLAVVGSAKGIKQVHKHGSMQIPHAVRWQVCKLGVRRIPLPSLSVARTNTARHWQDSISAGAGRLRVMVTEATRKFGQRLSTLLDASVIEPSQLARYMGRTVEQIEKNYMGGRQFPTGNGMYKLFILFGIPMGQIYGTEPLNLALIDKNAIHERLSDLT
jgi:hypothetical protein